MGGFPSRFNTTTKQVPTAPHCDLMFHGLRQAHEERAKAELLSAWLSDRTLMTRLKGNPLQTCWENSCILSLVTACCKGSPVQKEKKDTRGPGPKDQGLTVSTLLLIMGQANETQCQAEFRNKIPRAVQVLTCVGTSRFGRSDCDTWTLFLNDGLEHKEANNLG